ncbi:capsular polysaccharide biosynthesis protein [Metabacillus elymi]|uniref:Capsular polysaccharide biosynthesis protein n=1 Tax=Metabacillus elymi TaxID=2745198 RepID=A0ABX6RZF5_9BACI|nr:capsular polysaccharide biosynthesis protein [Metabacillus sp. KUDC1714]QNF27220.1 capsular polysaccharide biosynthesis protein [Metabacillus sp. KUDC1714]
MIGVFCPKGQRMPFMDSFFQERITYLPAKYVDKLTGITAYGNETYIQQGKKLARKKNLPYYTIENGLSSQLIDDKQLFEFDYSLLIDNNGSIKNSEDTTQLEQLLNSVDIDANLLKKAKEVFDYITKAPLTSENIVLVDERLERNNKKEDTFKEMLERAKNTYATNNIKVLSTFDEEGYLKKLCQNENVEIISSVDKANQLIHTAKKVFVIESITGFMALLQNREVHCFGLPFYSGLGLTTDEIKNSRRTKQRTILELFTIFFYFYEKQINPLTGMPTNLNEIIKIIEDKKDSQLESKEKKIYCFGIQPWKRGFVRPFVKNPYNTIYFPKTVQEVQNKFDTQSELLVWGHKEPADVRELAEKWNKPVMRIEDGFIRSVGLGTNVTLPWSLALDHKGIYYNPQQVSELEHILTHQLFTENMLEDAMNIRKKIVENQLTKYNSEPIESLNLPSEGKKVILVPGQVEDDASIRYGCKDIKTNTELLNSVREKNQDAYIIYKPHPDIVSRNRQGEVTSDFITDACDHIEIEASIISCINYADEVHTMTSLTGFDALLRDKTVYTYGSPFYSGWGLTHDRHSIDRRKRTLTLDELIAGALLVYPRYFDWENGIRVSCDTVIDKLIEKRNMYFDNRQANIKIPNRLKKVGFLLKEMIENH